MIWQRCNGEQQIQALTGTIYRLAESQEQIATRRYVDSLQEQAVLEELLESSKPEYEDYSHLDYLLRSPFRYPPLEHGSRFGRPHEMSLFYGAESLHTTLTEVAYYRFIFFQDIEQPPHPLLTSEHTTFSVSYFTNNGIKLQSTPFDQFEPQLRNPTHYADTQQLGSDMREAGVEAFEYLSARDTDRGICIGLFTPAALIDRKPEGMTTWLCEVDSQSISFKRPGKPEIILFSLSQFIVNGMLPRPA